MYNDQVYQFPWNDVYLQPSLFYEDNSPVPPCSEGKSYLQLLSEEYAPFNEDVGIDFCCYAVIIRENAYYKFVSMIFRKIITGRILLL